MYRAEYRVPESLNTLCNIDYTVRNSRREADIDVAEGRRVSMED
jgi:hypothetical protein